MLQSLSGRALALKTGQGPAERGDYKRTVAKALGAHTEANVAH